MILSLALFMLMPQPAELPEVVKPTVQPVSIATAIKPASLPATAAPSVNTFPAAPSEVIMSTESTSIDASLASAPTVVSPALIMAVAPVTPQHKKTLKEEHPTALKVWKGLAVAQSSAAAFDAWTTRRNIETGRFVETNSWLKPFAGNASLYAVMQVRPMLFDYAGHRMLRSNKKWVRNLWWVPQTAQTVTNLWCGAKNMSIH